MLPLPSRSAPVRQRGEPPSRQSEGQVESCSDDDSEAERTPATEAPAAAARPGEGAMVAGGGAPANDAAEVPAQPEATRPPAQGASSSALGTTSGGGDMFAQARRPSTIWRGSSALGRTLSTPGRLHWLPGRRS